MSISSAQADALAEGFFDGLGSSKEGLQPKKSLSALFLLAGGLVVNAQKNLEKSNSNASGKGSESLKVLDPKTVGKTIKMDVVMNSYLQFINKGVRGTKGGGASPYSFKYSNPSKKHVAAIEAYLRRAGKSVTNIGKSTHGKNEAKNKKLSLHQSAYAYARAIKMGGIKKTGFMDKAIESTRQQAKEELGKALKLDIIDSLPKTLG